MPTICCDLAETVPEFKFMRNQLIFTISPNLFCIKICSKCFKNMGKY